MLAGFSKVVFELYRAAQEQPVAGFQDAALELVKTAVPFDSALWITGTLDLTNEEGGAFHTRHLHRQPLQLLTDWMRTKDRATLSRKVFSSPGMTHNCVTSREFGPELAEHARRYGIEHILATARIDPVPSLHELISVYRADIENPFSEADRLFLQAIVPHLAETWRVNRLIQLTQASQSPSGLSSGSAAADANGILHLVQPGFASILQEEWPGWRGPRLPNELVNGIKSGGGQFVGEKFVFSFAEVADQFLLRSRRKSPVDSLSERKSDVARLFAAGHTHKEIATRLGLSPATVRNYLSQIYRMLGIGSKAELANLLNGYA